jgi:DNA processing protein
LGKKRLSWVALNLALCPNSLVLRNLLERFATPEAILAAPAEALSEVSGVTGRLLRRIKNSKLQDAARSEIERAERQSVRILLRDDPGFPGILTQLPDPPPLLYMRGDLRDRDDPAVAVVGSRRATIYGLEMARLLACEIAAAGVTVVSGLARGIDQAAHGGALEAGGRTLAFLGSGIDRIYPRECIALAERISSSGAILSEFPMGTPPLSGNFPVRNRLISGVARGTLVVEAAARSGSLITARMALEQGREVFAVPGNITCETALGPNLLIQQGAKLVMQGRDVLEEIPGAPLPPEVEETAAEPAGSEEEENILRCLSPADPLTLDELAGRTAMQAGPLLAALLKLEIEDRVRQLPGSRFTRKRRGNVGQITRHRGIAGQGEDHQ